MMNMKMSSKGTFEKTVVSGANHKTAALSLDKTANTALLLGYQGHLGGVVIIRANFQRCYFSPPLLVGTLGRTWQSSDPWLPRTPHSRPGEHRGRTQVHRACPTPPWWPRCTRAPTPRCCRSSRRWWGRQRRRRRGRWSTWACPSAPAARFSSQGQQSRAPSARRWRDPCRTWPPRCPPEGGTPQRRRRPFHCAPPQFWWFEPSPRLRDPAPALLPQQQGTSPRRSSRNWDGDNFLCKRYQTTSSCLLNIKQLLI